MFVDSSAGSDEAGILKALLIGERGSVPRVIDDLYARGGVNHILSISGFHIGIIALVLYGAMTFCLRLFELPLLLNLRRFLPFLVVPILFWYLLLTGAAPATLRSFLMIVACFLGLYIERETDSLNLLALAALCILMVWPQALFDLSFQLSFLALWGILVLTPIFMKPFPGMKGGMGYRLLQFCMVSLAAILATLLPVAYQFHRASLTGLISNLVVVPLLGYGAVVIGFTGLLLSFCAPVPAAFMIQAAGLLVRWSNRFLSWLDSIPQLPHFTPSLVDVFLVTGFLAILTVFRRTRSRLVGGVIILFILAAEHGIKSDSVKEMVRVDFFSLGQCESTLVRLPGGRTMLVDGGGALFDGGMDVGEKLLAPALWSLGVDRIDYMVLSHPHPDHLKGLLFVAENFTVGEFWESGYPCDDPSYLKLKQILYNRGVTVRVVNSGIAPFSLEGGAIEPLWPVGPTASALSVSSGESDVNDESMGFRLVSGRFSMLFTGDSGFPVEAYLLGTPARLRSTVLKVAHHGSRRSTSTPFLKEVSPRIALISAGYRNRFHLPSRETLLDIDASGATIYRTDRDGTIEIAANPVTGVTIVSRILPSLR
jgi:competence protein ComEC